MDIIRNSTVDAILARRSVRKYTSEKVSEAELDTLLQCGLWAPSARNAQTTMLVLIGRDLIDELEKEYMSTLDKAPKFMAGGFTYGAPHLDRTCPQGCSVLSIKEAMEDLIDRVPKELWMEVCSIV